MNPFFPKAEYRNAYEIPYADLFRNGTRGLIFDIDNTLVLPDAPADKRSRDLFAALNEMGFKTCLLSNNKERRVQSFSEDVGTFFICRANKPSVKGFRKAMDLMGTDEGSTVSIGDQLFTDIWGANRAGMSAILVTPQTEKEEIQIIAKRILEKPFLFFYHRKKNKKTH